MRRVSIGMIEAVLLIKYRNTQLDSTAVLRKEYWQIPQPSIQVAITKAGTSAMAPPRIPLGDRRDGVVCHVWHRAPAIISRPLLYLIIFGRGRAFRRTYRTGRAMAFPGGG